MAELGDSEITDDYAIYCDDCLEMMPALPDKSVHLSIYSPPFGGLYNYSSSDRDLSNCRDYEQFFEHYEYVVREISRITMPGRLTVVHAMDVPSRTKHAIRDFPGDIIRLHEEHGFVYHDRKAIWKEPLKQAIRTRALGLRHGQIVKDATLCRSALADYLISFRRRGENPVPVVHPDGFTRYAGERPMHPEPDADGAIWGELNRKYSDWGDPKTDKRSHKIWQRYASALWDDIRIARVLPYRKARDPEDEKHVHPLQLDVIERCVDMWSNTGEVVFTPFMGVGSEVYAAVCAGRKGVGVELKPTYYQQAHRNIAAADRWADPSAQLTLAEA